MNSPSTAHRARNVYHAAKQFLIRELNRKGVKNAEDVLKCYIESPGKSGKPVPLNELFKRLLRSAQNASMKTGVIGGPIGGYENLGPALFGFNPAKVLRKFADNPDGLLDHIVETLNIEVRAEDNSLWPKYCKTILSAASFLEQFRDGDDFYEWVNRFYRDPRARSALPKLLEASIYGIGYTLACDFLKGLGFVEYGKPDVHVTDIITGTGLCPSTAKPYDIQNTLLRIAKAARVSPYNVDMVFWLIGSGKFDRHPDIGRIGRKKKAFIKEFNEASEARRKK